MNIKIRFFYLLLLVPQLYAVNLNNQQVISVQAQSTNSLICLSFQNDDNIATYNLFRLTTAGALDTSFGTSGFISFPANTVVNSFAITPSTAATPDQIVVAYQSQQVTTLQRYTPAGVATGAAVTLFTLGTNVTQIKFSTAATPVLIVIGTSLQSDLMQSMVTSRNNDATFTAVFAPVYLFQGYQTVAQVSAIDSSNRIVIGGQINGTSAFMARYSAAGALDGTFGSAGVQLPTATKINGIDFESTGNIVVCGANNSAAYLQKWNTNATAVVLTYNQPLSPAPIYYSGLKVVTSPLNAVLVSGATEPTNQINQLITQRNLSTGGLDTSGFNNSNGYIVTNSTCEMDSQGVVVYSAGTSIAYGSRNLISLMTKYLTTGLPDKSFGAAGILNLGLCASAGLGNYIYAYQTASTTIPTGGFNGIAFNGVGPQLGWTFAPTGMDFIVPESGTYHIAVDAVISSTVDANRFISVRLATVVGVVSTEVPGTQIGTGVSSASGGSIEITTHQFLANLTAGQRIQIQAISSGGSVSFTPQGSGSPTVAYSVAITRVS